MRAGIEVFYTLDRPPAGWSGFSGFVTDEMLLEAMPKAGSESVCVCVRERETEGERECVCMFMCVCVLCVCVLCVCECVGVSVFYRIPPHSFVQTCTNSR